MRKKHLKIRKKGLPAGTLVYTGDILVNSSDILVANFNENEIEFRHSCHPNLILKDHQNVHWIDVKGLSDVSTIEKIGSTFQINALVLEDVLDTQQRAKFEEYDNGVFYIASHIDFISRQEGLRHEQIALFWGENYLISFQEDPSDTFESVRNRLNDPKNRIRKNGVDYLANALLDLIVDNYYLTLDAIENELENIEESIFHAPNSPAVRHQIFQMKRIAIQFRRKLLPLRDATYRFLKSDSEFVRENNRHYFRDVHDHTTQIIEAVEHQIETLNSFLELAVAEAGNRLNHVMRLLTVISTIFIPLSFVAGVYGMNFDNMPELHWTNGYFYVLGLMFLASVAMLIYFKTKKWI